MQYFNFIKNISTIIHEHCDVSMPVAIYIVLQSPFTPMYMADKERVCHYSCLYWAKEIWNDYKIKRSI